MAPPEEDDDEDDEDDDDGDDDLFIFNNLHMCTRSISGACSPPNMQLFLAGWTSAIVWAQKPLPHNSTQIAIAEDTLVSAGDTITYRANHCRERRLPHRKVRTASRTSLPC